MLLAKGAHLGLDQVGDVERRADLRALARVQADQPPPELERRLHFDRLHLAHATMLTQFRNTGGADSAEPAERREQSIGKIQDVARPSTGPQDDGQQLGVREGAGASVLQPLAWSHRLRQVFQPQAVFGQAWRGDLCTPPLGRALPEIAASIAPPSGPLTPPERSSGPRRAFLSGTTDQRPVSAPARMLVGARGGAA